jgi:hypothetical protein
LNDNTATAASAIWRRAPENGCSMHATATALVRASLLDKRPNATPVELRQELFLRLYGNEFDKTKEKILVALSRVPHLPS